MAFNKITLFCVVAMLGLASASSNYQTYEGERNPFLFRKERHWRRIDTDAGRIDVVPIFRDSAPIVPQFLNFEANCIEMDPISLLVPQFINADWFMYVHEGKGRIGWVSKQKLIEQDLEKGHVYHVPKGAVFYLINTDKSQSLRIVNLLHNDNPSPIGKRQHQTLFVTGGQNPESVYSAFGIETTAAALGVSENEVRRLLNQNAGEIVSLGRGVSKILQEEENIWPWSSKRHQGASDEKPFNLRNKKAQISNYNGAYTFADKDDFRPLKLRDLGVSLTTIEQGRMSVPHWNSRASRITFVLSGRGLVRIAYENETRSGTDQERESPYGEEEEREQRAEQSEEQRQSGKERERESPYGEEEEREQRAEQSEEQRQSGKEREQRAEQSEEQRQSGKEREQRAEQSEEQRQSGSDRERESPYGEEEEREQRAEQSEEQRQSGKERKQRAEQSEEQRQSGTDRERESPYGEEEEREHRAEQSEEQRQSGSNRERKSPYGEEEEREQRAEQTEKQRQSERKRRGEGHAKLHRFEDEIRAGDVYVQPAGHPIVQIAEEERLEMFSFLVNVDLDEMHRLAGKNNDISFIGDDVLAASFNVQRKDVKNFFSRQYDDLFVRFRGRKSSKGGPRRGPWSIV